MSPGLTHQIRENPELRFPSEPRCGQCRSTPMSSRSVISSQNRCRGSADHQVLIAPAWLSLYWVAGSASRMRGGDVRLRYVPGRVSRAAPTKELRWPRDATLISSSPASYSRSRPAWTIWIGTAVPVGDRSVATITSSPSSRRTRFGRPVTVEISCPVSEPRRERAFASACTLASLPHAYDNRGSESCCRAAPSMRNGAGAKCSNRIDQK